MRPRSLLVPVVLAGLLLGCGGDDGDTVASLDGVVVERVGPYEHYEADIDYERPAPSGGDHPHAPYWLNCGVYEGQVPDELAVHSLEHGAVWIALGPESTEADRDRAVELAQGQKVVVSDVPDLPNPVELVAWGYRLPLDSLDDARAEQFVAEYVDTPGAPETGLSCSGALGAPPTPPELPFG